MRGTLGEDYNQPLISALAHRVAGEAVEPVVEAWQRIDGTKSLVIFEAVGVPGMIDDAMQAAPRGARVLVVGVCMEQDSIRPMLGIAKELDVSFALGYSYEEFAQITYAAAEEDDLREMGFRVLTHGDLDGNGADDLVFTAPYATAFGVDGVYRQHGAILVMAN